MGAAAQRIKEPAFPEHDEPAPAGRAGVSEIQRARILAAMGELVRECGAGGVTVAHVVSRSGVSRRTFYELFDDREDCFLAAFDCTVRRCGEAAIPAHAAGTYGVTTHGPGTRGATTRGAAEHGAGTRGAAAHAAGMHGAPMHAPAARWSERIAAGLEAALRFMDAEPDLAYLCVVGSLGAGQRALERRGEVVAALVAAVHEGRRGAVSVRRPDRLVAEGVVGAVLAIVQARLVERDARPLVGLLGPLMAAIVLPYLGAEAAERELRRRAPRRRAAEAHSRRDPLRDLDMRLTYRTVRVLAAIASEPASSNRQVAAAAGIADQGQISKLLSRLHTLGLISNAGGDHSKGEPNAWSLTPRGEDVQRSLQAQAA